MIISQLSFKDFYNYEIKFPTDLDLVEIIWKLLIGQADINKLSLKFQSSKTIQFESLLEKIIKVALERNVKELTIDFKKDYEISKLLHFDVF